MLLDLLSEQHERIVDKCRDCLDLQVSLFIELFTVSPDLDVYLHGYLLENAPKAILNEFKLYQVHHIELAQEYAVS